ncbi:MAG: polysaccharide pyruvyl transferase family protein [Rhodothermales bacterium]
MSARKISASTDNSEPFRACILGCSLNTGNMGVSALGASLVKLIKEAVPGAQISLFIGNRTTDSQTCTVHGVQTTVRIINYRLSPKSRPRDHLFSLLLLGLMYRMLPVKAFRAGVLRYSWQLSALVEAQFIGDIRGGDSFSDLYGFRRFLLGCIPASIVLLLGKSLVLLPQTYGPYRNSVARHIAARIISRAQCVMSRDQKGVQVVRKLVEGRLEAKRIRYCPDVAFSLEPRAPAGSLPAHIRNLYATSRSGVVVGVNVNGLVFNGGYNRRNMFGLRMDYRTFLLELVSSFLRESNTEVLLIPHVFVPPINSDHLACRNLKAAFASGADRLHLHTVEPTYDQHELKDIIAHCDFFVGTRMHSCIAALSQGVPTAGVAYSDKFIGVFKTAGAGACVIDARLFSVGDATAQILRLFQRRRELAGSLDTTITRVKQRLYREMVQAVTDGRAGYA